MAVSDFFKFVIFVCALRYSMEYYIFMVCESIKMKRYYSFKGCLLVLREKFKFLQLGFPKYFHCAIRIMSLILCRLKMIIKKN